MMEQWINVLVKRLLPSAAEINAYVMDGLVLGYARDEANELLTWPDQTAFVAEWAVLEAELAATQPLPPVATPQELQTRIEDLEQAFAELLLGGV